MHQQPGVTLAPEGKETLEAGLVLAREVAAILNRPRPDAARNPDDCPECQALRRRPFACKLCGYSGVPAVDGCTCVAEWRAWRRRARFYYERAVEEPEGGGWQFGRKDLTVDDMAQRLAVADALPKPAPRCRVPRVDGQYFDGCCHGCVSCPVCYEYGSDNTEPLASRIREVRRFLRSVGAQ